MASPPQISPATSPPHSGSVNLPNNPRKRPSLHFTSSQQYNPSKRRKQGSIASATSSAHPLRQTSFPPEESGLFRGGGQRSPSIDSDVTGVTREGSRSVISAHTGNRHGKKKPGRKVGRPSKADRAGDAGSKAGTARSGTHGDVDRHTAGGDAGGDSDEDDDDDAGEGAVMEDTEDMDRAAERKNLSVLVDAFNQDQAERYEMFRRVKLRKETVRKIANFTLAQSVPPAVITSINGYTKTFVGTLIERAREVQRQWSAIETPPQSPDSTLATTTETHFSSYTMMGPLLPDHLREALRRHKRDGEAHATGLTGFSVGLGIPGAGSAPLQGRRLFR